MRREINWKRNKWLMGTVPPNKLVAGTKQTEILLFSKLLLLVCHGWMLISNLFLPVCQGSVPPCYALCFTDCGAWGTCLDSVDILLLESQAWGQFCQTLLSFRVTENVIILWLNLSEYQISHFSQRFSFRYNEQSNAFVCREDRHKKNGRVLLLLNVFCYW